MHRLRCRPEIHASSAPFEIPTENDLCVVWVRSVSAAGLVRSASEPLERLAARLVVLIFAAVRVRLLSVRSISVNSPDRYRHTPTVTDILRWLSILVIAALREGRTFPG